VVAVGQQQQRCYSSYVVLQQQLQLQGSASVTIKWIIDREREKGMVLRTFVVMNVTDKKTVRMMKEIHRIVLLFILSFVVGTKVQYYNNNNNNNKHAEKEQSSHSDIMKIINCISSWLLFHNNNHYKGKVLKE